MISCLRVNLSLHDNFYGNNSNLKLSYDEVEAIPAKLGTEDGHHASEGGGGLLEALEW